MKFKLGIVAGVFTLATLLANSAIASTVSATSLTYSQEGLATSPSSGVGSDIALPAFTANIASELAASDAITVAITGVTLDAALSPTITCVDPNANTAGLTIGFVSQSPANPNILNFRVTNRSGINGTSTIGEACTSAGITATAANLAKATAVTMTWTATTALSNLPEDLLCATASTNALAGVASACVAPAVANYAALLTVQSQFAQSVTCATCLQLNGVVDVATFYDSFASFTAPDTAQLQQLGGTVTNLPVVTTGVWTTVVVPTNVAVDITGNFSEIPAATGTPGVCKGTALANYAVGFTYLLAAPTFAGNCAAGTLSFTEAGAPALAAGVPQAFAVNILQPVGTVAKPALALSAPQTFTGDVTWTYTGTSGTTGIKEVNTIAPGSWTLNGFTARVGYMPYDAAGTISRVIYLSNNSSEAGTATMTANDSAGKPCPASGSAMLGAVGANAVTSLGGAVDAAVAACYGAGITNKVDVTITATIPQSAGYLFSAYTVGGTSRQIIVNKSNTQ